MRVVHAVARRGGGRGPIGPCRPDVVRNAALPATLVLLLFQSLPREAWAQGGLALEPESTRADVVETEAAEDGEAIEPRPGIPPGLRQVVITQASQYEQALGGSLGAHLALLRTLHGELTPEQRRAIARDGGRAVKVAAMRASEHLHATEEDLRVAGQTLGESLVEAVGSVARNLFGIEKRREEPRPVDPQEFLAEAMGRVVETRIGAEAAREFAAEWAARQQRRRDGVVREVVAKLDEDLVFTDDQCEAIEQALRDVWTESLALVPMYDLNHEGRKIYPGLPRRVVRGLLTDAQRERFGGDEESDVERANRDNWQRMSLFLGSQEAQAERDPWWYE